MIDVVPAERSWVHVTFHLSSGTVAGEIAVVGEFNGWDRTATPMHRTADGITATVRLRVGRTYRFRYLLDGERWENDWEADVYVPNEFGGDDSVVDLTAGGPRRAALGALDVNGRSSSNGTAPADTAGDDVSHLTG